MRIEGVHVAVITPFRANGEVCYETFSNHLEGLAAEGVRGFVSCATTGENPTITPTERLRLLELSVEIAGRHGLSVIAGCGSNDTRQAIDLTQEAKSLGCHAALIVTPYYNKPSPAGVIAHYEKVANEGDLPIVLYNVPSRTSLSLSVETIVKLFENPKIIGIKEASGHYGQWLALSAAMATDKKSLLSGDDDCFAPMMALGGSGIISASANVAASLFVSLYEHAHQGDFYAAFALQKKLYPLVRAMFTETNPCPIKYAMSRQKRAENVVRLPLVPVLEGTRLIVDKALHDLNLVSP